MVRVGAEGKVLGQDSSTGNFYVSSSWPNGLPCNAVVRVNVHEGVVEDRVVLDNASVSDRDRTLHQGVNQ